MLYWTREELRKFADEIPGSDAGHVPFRADKNDPRLAEIYARAVGCEKLDGALEFAIKTSVRAERKKTPEELHAEFVSREVCHSPAGNGYICFCADAQEAGP